jgi:S-disulfanyl-L-cysteine oxidoreductase SoxD
MTGWRWRWFSKISVSVIRFTKRIVTRNTFFILCLIGVILVASACRAPGTENPSANSNLPADLPSLDPQRIEKGERIYVQHCSACHGLDLEGEVNWKEPNPDGSFRAPPHDASGHTWHHGDAQLIEAIRWGGARLPANFGASNMPAYEEILTEAEMIAVLDYIKSAWPDELRVVQWQQTLQTGTP